MGRVYFENGHFQMGYGNDKLGASSVLTADFDPATGLALVCHDGRCLWVPAFRCQVTYNPA